MSNFNFIKKIFFFIKLIHKFYYKIKLGVLYCVKNSIALVIFLKLNLISCIGFSLLAIIDKRNKKLEKSKN